VEGKEYYLHRKGLQAVEITGMSSGAALRGTNLKEWTEIDLRPRFNERKKNRKKLRKCRSQGRSKKQTRSPEERQRSWGNLSNRAILFKNKRGQRSRKREGGGGKKFKARGRDLGVGH